MKLSEVSLDNVRDFCGISSDTSDDMVQLFADGAKHFILSQTGLDEAEADDHDDLTLAFMTLVNEMYTNRTYTVDVQNVNPFASDIIGQHRTNLL